MNRRQADPLRWEYTGLRVRSLPRSERFYRRLGFREVGRGRMEHGGRYIAFALSNSTHQLELNFYPRTNRFYTPIRRGTEFDHLGFHVRDIDAWARRVRRGGFRVAAEWEEQGLRLLFLEDPDGNWLEVAGRTRERTRAPPGRRAP